jgi:hypothetical protein
MDDKILFLLSCSCITCSSGIIYIGKKKDTFLVACFRQRSLRLSTLEGVPKILEKISAVAI